MVDAKWGIPKSANLSDPVAFYANRCSIMFCCRWCHGFVSPLETLGVFVLEAGRDCFSGEKAVSVVAKYPCPVCSFPMDDPASDWNICPSCGTEFGLHDVNSSVDALRKYWLDNGAKWWAKFEPKPDWWNPTAPENTNQSAPKSQRDATKSDSFIGEDR